MEAKTPATCSSDDVVRSKFAARDRFSNFQQIDRARYRQLYRPRQPRGRLPMPPPALPPFVAWIDCSASCSAVSSFTCLTCNSVYLRFKKSLRAAVCLAESPSVRGNACLLSQCRPKDVSSDSSDPDQRQVRQ